MIVRATGKGISMPMERQSFKFKYPSKTASTKGKIVGTVKKNQTVTVLQKTGSWYKIQYGKKTGYVAVQYLINVK